MTLKFVQYDFPLEGIRFISISEGYDSGIPEKSNSRMLLTAKGMVNEQHCENTSNETKKPLEY